MVVFVWAVSLAAGATQQDGSHPPLSSGAELSDPKLIEQRADIFMARKFFPEAIELYERLTRMEPRNPQYFNKLGIAHHQLQQLDAAKRAYRRALQLNPRYSEAINNLAAVEYAQKNYRGAILTYLKALSLSPGDAVVYSNLGTAYFAYEKFDFAMDSYRYALALDPNIFSTSSGRMGSIVQQREIKDVGAFNFQMARTYASLGNIDRCVEYLYKAWEEGYKELRKGLEDKVFIPLANHPKYVEFLAFLEAKEQEATTR